jgi:hypothetical protein
MSPQSIRQLQPEEDELHSKRDVLARIRGALWPNASWSWQTSAPYELSSTIIHKEKVN